LERNEAGPGSGEGICATSNELADFLDRTSFWKGSWFGAGGPLRSWDYRLPVVRNGRKSWS